MAVDKLRKRLKKLRSDRRPAAVAPTMIVPSGADLKVDQHGHLSIRTPGNLVLQTSGTFGAIESISGSVRIEPDAEVEAITVRCAESCYVQGSLTAWKVTARAIELADGAKAKIVLQRSERLKVGKGARLVGNFASEKELYTLFSRYASYFDEKSFPVDAEVRKALLEAKAEANDSKDGGADEEETEVARRVGAGSAPLAEALGILERELERDDHDARSKRLLVALARLIEEEELEALRHTHATLFRKIGKQTRPLRRAAALVRDYF